MPMDRGFDAHSSAERALGGNRGRFIIFFFCILTASLVSFWDYPALRGEKGTG